MVGSLVGDAVRLVVELAKYQAHQLHLLNINVAAAIVCVVLCDVVPS
jgi:hypothetical protein